jgi:hypothetical protein
MDTSLKHSLLLGLFMEALYCLVVNDFHLKQTFHSVLPGNYLISCVADISIILEFYILEGIKVILFY